MPLTNLVAEDNVLLGAGANVLGPVTVGRNSKIGAGSMVIANIPPNCVAGTANGWAFPQIWKLW